MGVREWVQYSGARVEDNLRLRAVVRHMKKMILEDPEQYKDIRFILKQQMAAMKLVKTPLYIPNPELDEKGWDMQHKYTCDCFQVYHTLRRVPEYLKRMLSEKLNAVFGEGFQVLCKQLEENVWMRLFLAWTYLGYEQCRDDQLVFVKKCKVPMSDGHVLEQLVKEFNLRAPPPCSCGEDVAKHVLLDLAYELKDRFYNLVSFDEPLASVDVTDDLDLVEKVAEDPLSSVDVTEDVGFEDPLTFVDVMEDVELMKEEQIVVEMGEDLTDGVSSISLFDSGYVLV